MDTKKMAGKDEFGTPCAFYIGRGVSAVNSLGSPAFSSMLDRAFSAKRKTARLTQ
jgi:hypothetical protein